MNSDPKRVVEEGYDRVAHEYPRLEETEWPRMRWLKKLLNQLEPNSSVLDLGCGSGDPADVEISKAHQITGVDISQVQINLARQNVPTGHFLHGDAGSVEFAPASFDAVISFYTLEHLPREEHKIVLGRIYQWLRPGGFLLLSMEAGEYDDVTDKWLGVPMFISCFDPETMKRLVYQASFEILETAIEVQVEQNHDVPYLWVLARKR
jgi:ubiquinone/menaquinone biosynthesis C-methylase UbiE